MRMKLPAYHDVCASLDRINSTYDASGGHALLCGMLVVNVSTPMLSWVKELVIDDTAPADLDSYQNELLQNIYEMARCQLQDTNLGFELLMPDDSSPLSVRVNALSLWSQGFLLGLSLAGIGKRQAIPPDSAELISDFARISQAEHNNNADQEDEMAYLEVLEYLKVGVLLINEELQPVRQSSRLSQ